MLKPKAQTKGKLPYLEVKYLRNQLNPKYQENGLYIQKNSFVILVDGENSGEVFCINEDGYMGSTFMQLLFSKYVNSHYIGYLIDNNKKYLKNNKKGSAIPHLNKELFKNLSVNIHSLSNQNNTIKILELIFNELKTIKAELN